MITCLLWLDEKVSAINGSDSYFLIKFKQLIRWQVTEAITRRQLPKNDDDDDVDNDVDVVGRDDAWQK